MSWRYSALTQINSSNGNSLKLAWQQTYPAPTTADAAGQGDANPLAYNGILYHQDKYGRIFAVDGTSGKILWSFDPLTPLNAVISGFDYRSISIGDGMVFTGQLGSIYALNAETGQQVWATQLVDPNGGGGIDAAPVYYNGVVYDGTTGGDVGGPCLAFALDAKTGKVNWFYNIIPSKPGQANYNTWPKVRAYYGGGAIWDPPTVDPRVGLVYFPIGNPVPYVGWANGPGMEKNTESTLALTLKGKYAWDFQEVHHDIWDYDGMQTPIAESITQGGKIVPIVTHINKDAYAYPLYAATGKPVVKVNEVPVPQEPRCTPIPRSRFRRPRCRAVRTSSSPTCRLIPAPGRVSRQTASRTSSRPHRSRRTATRRSRSSLRPTPAASSGRRTRADPQTGLEYLCANESDFGMESYPPQDVSQVQGNFAGFLAIKTSYSPTGVNVGRLIALNPATDTIAWSVNTPNNTCGSNVTTTASGLVLISRGSGAIQAYDAKTGAMDWQFTNADTSSTPRFTLYAAGGKEYIVSYTSSADKGEVLSAYSLG